MSYLSNPASTNEYGVVEIGDFIKVADGVISLPQSVETTASVVFSAVTATNGSFSGILTAANKTVLTNVVPIAAAGIGVSNVVYNNYTATFTVTNLGVISLTAGSGISLSANTGNIVISSFGADLINVKGVTANYTATITDEYIGVYSTNAVTISLPIGFDGRVYTIKDEYGQGSGKITIQPSPGELVDNKINYIISIPNQSVSMVSRLGNWWIM